MKKMLILALIPALAGCLTSTEPNITYWPLSFDKSFMVPAAKPKVGVARIAQISVNPPYDGAAIPVLRNDGSVAFDSYNCFAAVPSQLLRGPVIEAVVKSGLTEHAVGSDSIVRTDVAAEFVITRMCLDCRKDGERHAVVDLLVRLTADRSIKSIVYGSGSADAAEGDYSKSFSIAFSKAISQALGNLR